MSLELFKYAKGFLEFAYRLQGDLGIPTIEIVMGHAQNGQHHFTVERKIRAAGSHLLKLHVDLINKVQALAFEVLLQVIGLVGHVLLLLYNILGRAAKCWAQQHKVSRMMA